VQDFERVSFRTTQSTDGSAEQETTDQIGLRVPDAHVSADSAARFMP
jgi:hypothetical protein